MAVKCAVELMKVQKGCGYPEMPRKDNIFDTGYDIKLIGIEKFVGDVVFFKTGLKLAPTKGYYLEIVPRSSISKLPLSLANSVAIIDNEYRGEVLIPIRFHHAFQGEVKSGDSAIPAGLVTLFEKKHTTLRAAAQTLIKEKPYLCQFIMRKRLNVDFELGELDDTIRGEGGFGSTDEKK